MLGPDPDRPPGAPSTPYGVNHTSRLSAGPEAIAGANDALAALAPDAGGPAGPAGTRSRSSRGSWRLWGAMIPLHRGVGRLHSAVGVN